MSFFPRQREGATSLPSGVKPLRSLCLQVLIRHKEYIGDVGYIDAEAVRDIAIHCTHQELQQIEDETRSGSLRDLSWYTWHVWHRLYTDKYGGLPVSTKVPALQQPKPEDYQPPAGFQHLQPGDWRTLLEAKEAEIAAKKAAASERLRSAYAAEQQLKHERSTEVTNRLPPPKRQRTTKTLSFNHTCTANSTLTPKQQQNLKALGLLGKTTKSATGTKYAQTKEGTVKIVTQKIVHKTSSAGIGSGIQGRTVGCSGLGVAAASKIHSGNSSSIAQPKIAPWVSAKPSMSTSSAQNCSKGAAVGSASQIKVGLHMQGAVKSSNMTHVQHAQKHTSTMAGTVTPPSRNTHLASLQPAASQRKQKPAVVSQPGKRTIQMIDDLFG